MTDDTGISQGSGVGYRKPPEDKQFGKPGGNKRNRNGRPKSFDQLRKLVQRILAEDLPTPDGNKVTRAEALIRVMSSSKQPADRATLLAYGYGKPKDEINLNQSGKTEIVIRYADGDHPTETTPETTPDKAGEEAI